MISLKEDGLDSIAEKEHKMVKHPWTIAGFCIMGAGLYTMQSSSQVGGGMAMTLGGIITLASQYNKSRKLKKLTEDVRSFIHARGYDFFRRYANRKDLMASTSATYSAPQPQVLISPLLCSCLSARLSSVLRVWLLR